MRLIDQFAKAAAKRAGRLAGRAGAGPKAGVLVCAVAAVAVLFAATVRYEYPDLTDAAPRLTAGHVVDPTYAGTTFRMIGRVIRSAVLRQGIVVIALHDPVHDLNIDLTVFPSLGRLPVVPAVGEIVHVVGSLGSYRGRPQIRPLSAAHVRVVESP